jgi:hypothetical protein
MLSASYTQVEEMPLPHNLPGIFLVNCDFFCLISEEWRILHLLKKGKMAPLH